MVVKDEFHFGGKALTPFNIAWYIAPLINAVSRTGTASEQLVVFESMLEHLAYVMVPSTKRGCKGQYETRVEQAIRTCTNVKNRQGKLRDAAAEVIMNIIEQEKLYENKIIAVRLDPTYAVDKNLTGLIANSILDTFCRPILILNKVSETVEEEIDGKIVKKTIIKWQGSARGYEKSGMGSFKDLLNESGLIEFGEGHAYAFGVSIPEENYDKLIAYVNEKYKDFDCSPVYNVDLILDGKKEIDVNIFEDIVKEEKIWGKGVEDPFIAIENFRIYGNQIQLVGVEKGKPTITIRLDNGSSFIKFQASQEEFDSLYSKMGYVTVNIIGQCSRSRWGTPQLNIVDYEIIERNNFYF